MDDPPRMPSGGDDDGATRSLRTDCDWSRRNPSLEIPKAIAVVENVDPTRLVPECELRLYDYIDPDALDTLITAETGDPVEITLVIHGYLVVLDAEGFEIEFSD